MLQVVEVPLPLEFERAIEGKSNWKSPCYSITVRKGRGGREIYMYSSKNKIIVCVRVKQNYCPEGAEERYICVRVKICYKIIVCV